jgi:hypothetical protein
LADVSSKGRARLSFFAPAVPGLRSLAGFRMQGASRASDLPEDTFNDTCRIRASGFGQAEAAEFSWHVALATLGI